MTNADLRACLAKPAFPRASQYDPELILQNMMGPHVLWLAEYLASVLKLEPGMRVLDLGCGRALSAIFFAKEFGPTVWAADLWIKPTDNLRRIADAGLAERVFPISAEAHALPFAEGYFDRIVSLDAYQYFGTDDLYLGHIVKYLKPGGQIAIVCPGVREERTEIPEALKPYWEADFGCFHSPSWWRHHWQKTGLVEVEAADFMPNGHDLWLEWNKLCADVGPERFRAESAREAEMLEQDTEKWLGFTRVVGRRVA